MAQYTLQLRELESLEGREGLKTWFEDYNLEDYLTPAQIQTINERGVWSKEKLADQIIDHYYTREIGLETPALFKLKLKVALREIMEEKAPLIWTASLNINPLNEFEVTTVSDGSGSSNSSTNTTGLNIHSNTPQGKINKSQILNGDYASSTDGNEGTANSQGNDTTHNNTKSSGRNRSEVMLLREYRENIIMINREIVNDLADLFIGIY
jgi:hypothetical protein